jgi:chromosome partitioning protein
VLTGQVATEDGIYETSYENLYLIPADRGLFKVSDYLSSSGTGAFILKLRLNITVVDRFNYCI